VAAPHCTSVLPISSAAAQPVSCPSPQEYVHQVSIECLYTLLRSNQSHLG
jgi:hypothetical protein